VSVILKSGDVKPGQNPANGGLKPALLELAAGGVAMEIRVVNKTA